MSTDHATTGRVSRFTWTDAAAYAVFCLVGVYLMSGLLADPLGRHVAANWQDSVQNQWLLTHAARLFTHGENPFFTNAINAPSGVNLMANTSVLALALPLAPITLVFGAGVSAAVLMTLAPVSTAAAWYHVLSRHLFKSRPGPFVGALFAGFAPSMVSHSSGHPNIVAQFVLPFLLLSVLRFQQRERAVRTGLELAGLVIVQIFINEEMLFLTAVTLGIFLLALAIMRPNLVLPNLRSGLISCGIAAGLAGIVVAVPLYLQFFGPMAYQGLPTFVLDYGADLASFPAYAKESVGALLGSSSKMMSANLTEQNAFFGWPLLLLLAIILVQLRRDAIAIAIAVTGLVMSTLALGRELTVNQQPTGTPGPWAMVSQLPLFDSVVPTRLTMFVTPLIAILLAMSITQANRTVAEPGVRFAWICAVAAALLPIFPTPVDVAANQTAPEFFTSGQWRSYIPAGATVLPIPLGWNDNVAVMQWQLATDLSFRTVGGYYLAPAPSGSDRRAKFGPQEGAAIQMFNSVSDRGLVTGWDSNSEQVMSDLRSKHVDVVILPDNAGNAEQLRTAANQLLGAGEHVLDVWIWQVK